MRGSHRIEGRQEGGEVAPEMMIFHGKALCIQRRNRCKSSAILVQIRHHSPGNCGSNQGLTRSGFLHAVGSFSANGVWEQE